MQVLTERVILETDQAGHLIELPKLPCNVRVEAIFIVLGQRHGVKPRRRPHADIFGRTQFLGDVFTSVPEADWNLPE
ncbi:MAG: hypothetical protein Q8N35_18520 [Methylococcaceae bacterium]|nr:hypothetical protein [Methylococcaceae bacterium]MDZ4155018.1 hypothetical protein [Methylococcales bacterium]MDP2394537.1 hypothetical protein [Methylococcaceae bacterium]MDP3021581.1 hypothetical protein [Methylococcaceae bacterium]MDP3392080.1 hypothetical protein [Methylococcaceae bacterium]